MATQIGKYKILQYKDCQIVLFKHKNRYTFYIQKANATWHPMKTWIQKDDCEKYSKEYANNLI